MQNKSLKPHELKMLFGSQLLSEPNVLEVITFKSALGLIKVLRIKEHSVKSSTIFGQKMLYCPEQFVAEIIDGVGKEAFLPLVYDEQDNSPIYSAEQALSEVLQEAARIESMRVYGSS